MAVSGPTIDGLPWNDPEALRRVRAATEPDAELVYYDGIGPQRFDVLPLSVATDGGVEAVGVDRRRFPANVYLDGSRGWQSAAGSEARVGDRAELLDYFTIPTETAVRGRASP